MNRIRAVIAALLGLSSIFWIGVLSSPADPVIATTASHTASMAVVKDGPSVIIDSQGFVKDGSPQLDDQHCVGSNLQIDNCLAARNDGFVTSGRPQLDDNHCVGTPFQQVECKAARRGISVADLLASQQPQRLPQVVVAGLAYSSSSPSYTGSGGHKGYASARECVSMTENGGNYDRSNNPTHFGRYQFSQGSWKDNGGNPNDWGYASPQEQDQAFNIAWAKGYAYQYGQWLEWDGC